MQVSRRTSAGEASLSALNYSEYQILRGIVRGLSNKDMALLMKASSEDLERCRASMMRKLNATRTADAVRIALVAGIEG